MGKIEYYLSVPKNNIRRTTPLKSLNKLYSLKLQNNNVKGNRGQSSHAVSYDLSANILYSYWLMKYDHKEVEYIKNHCLFAYTL